jgi:peptide/nickel transport system permease protein
VTMAAGELALFARFTRSAMLDGLGQPYMRTAAAKGVPRLRAVRSHALPNAAIPLATMTGLYMGRIIAGAVITENVFAWPGVGSLLVFSVANRDLAVVQAIVIVDFAYRWLDPRMAQRSEVGR